MISYTAISLSKNTLDYEMCIPDYVKLQSDADRGKEKEQEFEKQLKWPSLHVRKKDNFKTNA